MRRGTFDGSRTCDGPATAWSPGLTAAPMPLRWVSTAACANARLCRPRCPAPRPLAHRGWACATATVLLPCSPVSPSSSRDCPHAPLVTRAPSRPHSAPGCQARPAPAASCLARAVAHATLISPLTPPERTQPPCLYRSHLACTAIWVCPLPRPAPGPARPGPFFSHIHIPPHTRTPHTHTPQRPAPPRPARLRRTLRAAATTSSFSSRCTLQAPHPPTHPPLQRRPSLAAHFVLPGLSGPAGEPRCALGCVAWPGLSGPAGVYPCACACPPACLVSSLAAHPPRPCACPRCVPAPVPAASLRLSPPRRCACPRRLACLRAETRKTGRRAGKRLAPARLGRGASGGAVGAVEYSRAGAPLCCGYVRCSFTCIGLRMPPCLALPRLPCLAWSLCPGQSGPACLGRLV